ncbi:MAG TPA: DUF3341 domain-containing protein [Blastocatellia bacterium]|nr:DUF3341 domain-containing protein [Blastocatellia bacterium]
MIGKRKAKLFGLSAEYADPQHLLEAARMICDAGYTKVSAYTPYPVEGLADIIVTKKRRVAAIFLIGGLIGGLGGFFMQYYAAGITYPINVAGRPLFSWPSFIPITFELTVLGAALFGAFGMLAINGLPQPYHPLFNVPRFSLATQSRFFILVEVKDPKFEYDATRRLLERSQPRVISDVYDW